MKGLGMKCVLIVLGVLMWWLSCLPYQCWEPNRTPGSMPARPRQSFTLKKWFENCSSSSIAIKLVLGSGSELELERFLWEKEKHWKPVPEHCLRLSPKLKTPWKSPASHLITTSFSWFLFCCFPGFPCDFIPSLLPSRLSLPDAICFQGTVAFFFLPQVLPSRPGLLLLCDPRGLMGRALWLAEGEWSWNTAETVLNLDMGASFSGLRPQGLV